MATGQTGYDFMGQGGYEHSGGHSGLGNDQFVIDRDYARLKMQADNQKEIAQLPWQFKREVFGKIYPLINNLASGGGSGGGSGWGGSGSSSGGSFDRVGGTNTPLPALPNSSIYSPDAIQGQVNAARAQGDQSAATLARQATESVAGRGFSSRSPMLQSIKSGIGTATAASNADQEREIRFSATGANAGQANTVAQLANTQWQNFNQADIERRKATADAFFNQQRNIAGLIGALSSLA
jgi:hypothetical protein